MCRKVDQMEKAIGSRISLQEPKKEIALEFIESISDILNIEDVQQLRDYHQHFKTTRYQHSINVAYYTFMICRKLNLDEISGARAGMLHDLYLYDWKNKEQPIEGRHSVVHPQVALSTAKQHFEVNDIMADAIVHHMWPMSIHMPKSKEGWVLQAVDKYCAVAEIVKQSCIHLKPQRVLTSMISMLLIVMGG